MRLSRIKPLALAITLPLLLQNCSSHHSSSNIQQGTVETQQGLVQGVIEGELLEFKGIPYAAPPIGDLRWRAPQPAVVRENTLLADQFGNRCWQRPTPPEMPSSESYTQAESEDCLYLNVYRPAGESDQPLPVMVWIPGGGLVSGSGSRPVNYGGNLARHDVVVVTVNYRLGWFGFFAHPELSAENPDNGQLYNYGLLDQIAALQWVQSNISNFGGDPDQVTIFGESAGGASVDALMASPLAKGLFSQVISQSGYGRGDLPRMEKLAKEGEEGVEAMAAELADKLSLDAADLATLRSLPPEKIVEGTNYQRYIQFAVDGVTLKNNVADVFAAGDQAQVPLMIGANDFEFGMVPPEAQKASVLKDILPEATYDQLTPSYETELLRDTLFISDYNFHSQIRALSQLQHDSGNPVYAYRFSVPTAGIQPPELPEKIYGAAHATELPYMFGNFTGDHMESKEPSAEQRQLSENMMSYWTNFAKTGNPNGEGLPEWPSLQTNEMMQLKLGGSEGKDDPWAQRLDTVNGILKGLPAYE